MTDSVPRPGSLFVVAAPSGAGKTSLVRALLADAPLMQLSVSFTTRTPRPGEVDGRDYFFVDAAGFERRREAGEFLEWAEVHGNYYGTSRVWIEEQMSSGKDILLEIDWQGARQVRSLFPLVTGIFILPPSLDVLAHRLTGRATDSPETIARRLAAAEAEMRHVDEFDYVIINDNLDQAVEDLCAVVRATRLRLAVQRTRHVALFSRLI